MVPLLMSQLSGRERVSEGKLPKVFHVQFPEYKIAGLFLAACFSVSFLLVCLLMYKYTPKCPQKEGLKSSPLILSVWHILKI